MVIYWRTNVACKILQERENGYFIIEYGVNSITSCHYYQLPYLLTNIHKYFFKNKYFFFWKKIIYLQQKGFTIYPDVFRINQEKLNYLLGENINIEGISWLQLYSKISLLRYRNPRISGKIDKNLKSKKSRIKIIS